MSLGLIPLALFLLYATVQDIRYLAVKRYTVILWGAVAVIGWLAGAWPFDAVAGLLCFGTLWLAGTGRGDRLGGLLIGGLMGVSGIYAVCLALSGCLVYCVRTGRVLHQVPLYPFLSATVAVIVGIMYIGTL